MIRNLKVLGLGLFAAFAVSALTAAGASANINAHTGGHFTQDSGGTATLHGIGGNEGNPHKGTLTAFGSQVTCEETYEGTMNEATTTSISIKATYTNCNEGRVVRMNGCVYEFTVRDTFARSLHNQVHFNCPSGVKTEVEAPGQCNITFGSQTITNAVTYTQITVNGKHAITADLTAEGLTYEKHGFCTIVPPFGTGPHTGASLTGSATLEASSGGNPVNLTATGSNGL